MKREIKMLVIAIVGMGSVGAAGFANAAAYYYTTGSQVPGYGFQHTCRTDDARTAVTLFGSTIESLAISTSTVKTSMKVQKEPTNASGLTVIGPTYNLGTFISTGALLAQSTMSQTLPLQSPGNYKIATTHYKVDSKGVETILGTSSMYCLYKNFKP